MKFVSIEGDRAMSPIVNKLSLQEFLDSPQSGDLSKFVDELLPGLAIPQSGRFAIALSNLFAKK